MWRELRAVFDGLRNDDGGLRCVVVRGEGGAFCAGGDISEYPSFRFEEPSLREFHENEVWAALQAMLDSRAATRRADRGCLHGRGHRDRELLRHPPWPGASAKFGAPIAKLGFRWRRAKPRWCMAPLATCSRAICCSPLACTVRSACTTRASCCRCCPTTKWLPPCSCPPCASPRSRRRPRACTSRPLQHCGPGPSAHDLLATAYDLRRLRRTPRGHRRLSRQAHPEFLKIRNRQMKKTANANLFAALRGASPPTSTASPSKPTTACFLFTRAIVERASAMIANLLECAEAGEGRAHRSAGREICRGLCCCTCATLRAGYVFLPLNTRLPEQPRSNTSSADAEASRGGVHQPQMRRG